MTNNSILFVGLGNPYEKYRGTRHNIGADFLQFYFKNKEKVLASNLWISKFQEKEIYILIEPDSMNISGAKVKEIMRKYNCKTLVVFMDDLDTNFGKVKLKYGVNHGGHNGTRDIINHIQTRDFFQVKIGIGRPESKDEVKDYVLSKFTYSEGEKILDVYNEIANILIINFFKINL